MKTEALTMRVSADLKAALEQQAEAAQLSVSALVAARLSEPGLPLNLKAVLDARAEEFGCTPRALMVAAVSDFLARAAAYEFGGIEPETGLHGDAPVPGMTIPEAARRVDSNPGGAIFGEFVNAHILRLARLTQTSDGTMALRAVKPKKKS
jgi:predicted transcriptional regulator